MAFLALAIESSSLILQKNQLEYQELILTEQLNQVTTEESDYLAENEDASADDAYYRYLENIQEQVDSQKASIESRLKAINAELDSYNKAVDNNIKNECKLSISA